MSCFWEKVLTDTLTYWHTDNGSFIGPFPPKDRDPKKEAWERKWRKWEFTGVPVSPLTLTQNLQINLLSYTETTFEKRIYFIFLQISHIVQNHFHIFHYVIWLRSWINDALRDLAPFGRFLNHTNGTKSRKESQIFL